MPRRKAHLFDQIADEVLADFEEDIDYYIEQIRGDTRAPFTADTSEVDKRNFFLRHMFTQNPEGTIDYTKPNAEGRSALMKMLGTKGYAQVALQIKPPAGMEMMTGREEDYDLAEDANGDAE